MLMIKIIRFITFFLFSGYYAFLAILIALNLTSVSRYVTVPLRLLTTILMLYVIVKIGKKKSLKNIYILLFICFWILYIIKVLLNFTKLPFESINEIPLFTLSKIALYSST